MAEAPWLKWFTNDFFADIADLRGDEIGVFAVIRNLMARASGPIDDDAAWIARRSGVSTRRFNQIRAKLLKLDILQARNGLLSHRDTLAEISKRTAKTAQAKSAAMARWHRDGEPELPLEDGTNHAPVRAHGAEIKTGLNGEKAPEQIDLNTPLISSDPQISAISGDADASSPVRARKSQSQSLESHPNPTHHDSPAHDPPPPDRLANHDLQHWVETISEASGHRPTSPDALNRAFRIAQDWRDAGFDLDKVVVPTIRGIVAHSKEATRTFGRFTPQISHEHARLKARGELGKGYAPPASPVLQVEGEEPVMATIRAELLQALGPHQYCAVANTARLEPVPDCAAGRKPLRIIQNGSGAKLNDGSAATAIRQIAKRHGFSEVW